MINTRTYHHRASSCRFSYKVWTNKANKAHQSAFLLSSREATQLHKHTVQDKTVIGVSIVQNCVSKDQSYLIVFLMRKTAMHFLMHTYRDAFSRHPSDYLHVDLLEFRARNKNAWSMIITKFVITEIRFKKLMPQKCCLFKSDIDQFSGLSK